MQTRIAKRHHQAIPSPRELQADLSHVSVPTRADRLPFAPRPRLRLHVLLLQCMQPQPHLRDGARHLRRSRVLFSHPPLHARLLQTLRGPPDARHDLLRQRKRQADPRRAQRRPDRLVSPLVLGRERLQANPDWPTRGRRTRYRLAWKLHGPRRVQRAEHHGREGRPDRRLLPELVQRRRRLQAVRGRAAGRAARKNSGESHLSSPTPKNIRDGLGKQHWKERRSLGKQESKPSSVPKAELVEASTIKRSTRGTRLLKSKHVKDESNTGISTIRYETHGPIETKKEELSPDITLGKIEPFPSIKDPVWHIGSPKSDVAKPSVGGSTRGSKHSSRNIKECDRSLCLACSVRGCGATFKKSKNLYEHNRLVHKARIPILCHIPNCGAMLKHTAYLRKHVLQVHGRLKAFPCDIPGCDAVLKGACGLKNHKLNVHGTKSYPCDVPGCPGGLKTLQLLKLHKLNRHGTDRHPCIAPGCKFVARTTARLNRYAKYGHGTMRYPCDVPGCGSIAKTTHDFNKHKVKVHGTEKYMCDARGFTAVLKTKENLKLHRRIQQRTERHACSFPACTSVLKSKQYLRKHKENVHGTNLYRCDIPGCISVFKSTCYLRIHIADAHGTKSPCDVPGCKTVLRSKYSLQRHKRQAHGVRSS